MKKKDNLELHEMMVRCEPLPAQALRVMHLVKSQCCNDTIEFRWLKSGLHLYCCSCDQEASYTQEMVEDVTKNPD